METYKAKAEVKADKSTARTEEERDIAHQMRKAKEAEAKTELHREKARHAAEKLEAKQSHHHHDPLYGGVGGSYYKQPVVGFTEPAGAAGPQPVGSPAPVPGVTAPTYPLGGHPSTQKR
ncbi:hypothetical protein Nepgr_011064 [Nepenthes gracilis]|uniref:Seed maturation protein n=1 Tax=Nepenthes gracilis TaxID=150966 RepID=A0AAD3XLX5_NEPGR|nr:hypothetical protein Nepgr_011064 [Nepenthes gracilis]